jgi:hypothetical protein
VLTSYDLTNFENGLTVESDGIPAGLLFMGG